MSFLDSQRTNAVLLHPFRVQMNWILKLLRHRMCVDVIYWSCALQHVFACVSLCLYKLIDTVSRFRCWSCDLHREEEGCCSFTRQQRQQILSHMHKHSLKHTPNNTQMHTQFFYGAFTVSLLLILLKSRNQGCTFGTEHVLFWSCLFSRGVFSCQCGSDCVIWKKDKDGDE